MVPSEWKGYLLCSTVDKARELMSVSVISSEELDAYGHDLPTGIV
jgi:hypothetical protein